MLGARKGWSSRPALTPACEGKRVNVVVGLGGRVRGRHTRLERRRPVRRKAREVTRALVNVDFGPAMVLGSGMVASGLALYQVRVVRPEVSKDYDIMFASIALLCGGILIFQGWRLDPLLLFGQILTAAAAATFAAEAVNLRGQMNDEIQARADRELAKERKRPGGSSLPGQGSTGEDGYYGSDYYSYSGGSSYGAGRQRGGFRGQQQAQTSGFRAEGQGGYGAGRSGSGSYVEFETDDQLGMEEAGGVGESFEFFAEGDDFGEDQDFTAYDADADWET